MQSVRRLLIRGWQRRSARRHRSCVHVVILDGTLSSLASGYETNAGLTWKLLREVRPPLNLYYEPGVQCNDWWGIRDVITGRGLNRQIRRAYGFLASRYQLGDRVYLFGYSRGAYAVRSLAGVIGRVGLLQPGHATVRNIRQCYRLYEHGGPAQTVHDFRVAHCHPNARICMIGVWDTVKALGLRLPFLWRLTEPRHSFHDHRLGNHVEHGFHALALNETRAVYTPVMWESRADFYGHVSQVWFRGAHGDIGGQLGAYLSSRPLANIPLVWMLEQAEECGLKLPHGWQLRFKTNPKAPSCGTWSGFGRICLSRSPRVVGRDPSETLHPTVPTTSAGGMVRAEERQQNAPDAISGG